MNHFVRHALERMRTVQGFEKVRFIILYGSVTEGRARAGSDIDLAVYYDGDREEEGDEGVPEHRRAPLRGNRRCSCLLDPQRTYR